VFPPRPLDPSRPRLSGTVRDLLVVVCCSPTICGSWDPNTLATRSNLARWRGQAGDPTGAATTTEQLLTDYLRVLGPDHPHTLTTRNNLAYWRNKTDDQRG
jgi:hypothetical protein